MGIRSCLVFICFSLLLPFFLMKSVSAEGLMQIRKKTEYKMDRAEKKEEKQERNEEKKGEISDIDKLLSLEQEYNAIQQVVDELSGEKGFSFRDYVRQLLNGDADVSLQALGERFFHGIKNEFSEGRKNISFLLAAGVAGGMLSALAGLFANRQAADTGFYILYLLLFSVLSVTFMELAALAEQVFSILLQFMRVLLPAYFLAIAFCSGARNSYVFYETMLLVITLVEIFMLQMILPAIKIYFVLGMVDHIAEKPFLTKLLELLNKAIRGSIKLVFLIVLSVHGIEAMLAPFVDSAAKSVLLKAVSAIPGLGSGAALAADALLKSGMLLKNAIGIAGLITILFLCAYPVAKILFYTGIYYLGSAFTEAVSEKRVMSCMEYSAHASGLLLYAACAGILLFLLTIGITLAATNR